MKFLILLKVALRTMRRTLLRTSLTALGIVIGVAAVIAMVSIGNGAKVRMEDALSGVDTNRLSVWAAMPRSDWRNGRQTPVPAGDGLNVDDYLAIREEIDGIAAATVQARASAGTIEANGRSSEARVVGVDVDELRVSARRLVSGTMFGGSDVHEAASVCLISESVARNLFSATDAVGQRIRIARGPFIVTGVLADEVPRGNRARPGDTDTSVLIPYTSLLRRLERHAQIGISLKAENPAQLGRIQLDVSNLLERRRGKRKAEFTTGNMEEAVNRYLEGSRTMTLLLGSISGISLLVGGIGIMNIMLVSVTERTREIGIRLAIGTRGRDVLRQFLIESVILSVLGGAVGIVLGAGAAYLITYLNDWPTKVTLDSVLAAFVCTAAIGVFFGYYPARQAARLDPIDALRSE